MGLRRLPLKWQLPLAFATAILVIVLGFTWIAWRGVRRSALDLADERLAAAATELAGALGASIDALHATTVALAADSAIIRVVRDGRGSATAEARLRLFDSTTAQALASVVWSRDGVRLAAHANRDVAPDSLPSWISTQWLGPFERRDSLIVYGSAAPILADGDTAGFLVIWRRGTGNPASTRLIANLIGASARFLIGTPGGLWTDFQVGFRGPPADIPDGATVRTVIDDRGPRVGQGRRIGDSPWWVWVGFPEEYVLGVSRAFLEAVLPVALALVLVGWGIGWRVSRTLTLPLERLALAADRLAAGDWAGRAPVDATPELSRLARAFNHMAGEVEAGVRDLEARVAERTRELREAQSSLVRKERLATLGQLASGVGHELRNPLGVMNNAAYFLQAVLKDAPDKVREYLGIIRHQIVLSEKIVGDLLDFARVKEPQRAKVRARDLLEAQLERAAPPGGVVVRRDYPEDPIQVVIDPIQVGQILFNLIVNAVQAMDDRGTLTLGVVRNGGGVILRVGDTGPGVKPEHRGHLFEPLFSTKARGIGLGLAVSRSLAEANGGHLDLEHTGPDGTVFAVFLPLGPR